MNVESESHAFHAVAMVAMAMIVALVMLAVLIGRGLVWLWHRVT